MASFLLQEIRNVLRLEGYKVTKHTNRRVINTLLELGKDSTMKDICEKLNMSYMGREGDYAINNNPKEIFLHFLEKKTTIGFTSLRDMREQLGIDIIAYRDEKEKVLEKIILVNGERAVLSLSNKMNRDSDFSPCLENKININLALSTKLGYVVDYNISLPEIFSILGEEIPKHRLKEKLCSLLSIPYYFEKRSERKKEGKKVRAIAGDETLVFNSLNSAGKFFQVNPK